MNTSAAFGRLRRALRGVSVVAATPFTSKYRLDVGGLSSNTDWLASSGVDTIVAGGGTGEYLSLTATEVSEVTRTIVATVNGRVPVIGAVGGPMEDARKAANAYAGFGIDALLIHHPYQPYVSKAGIVNYYRAIAGATTLPVILYVRSPLLDSDAFRSLASEGNIVGVKYAVHDLRLVSALGASIPGELGWAFVCGLAEGYAAAYTSLGARGFTSGIANFAPAISLMLRDSLNAGNSNGAAKYREEIDAFEQLRAMSDGAYNIAVIKDAMTASGLAAGPVRPPGSNLPATLSSVVRGFVESWKGSPSPAERIGDSGRSRPSAKAIATDDARTIEPMSG